MEDKSNDRSSKKRDFATFSQGNNTGLAQTASIYEDVNSLYKQLYLDRQKQKQKQDETNGQLIASNAAEGKGKINEGPKTTEIIEIKDDIIEQDSNKNGNTSNQVSMGALKGSTTIESKSNPQVNKTKTSNFEFKQQKSQFYINKLKQYPKEEHMPNMIGFSDIFASNPFYQFMNEQPQRADVQSIFMTTFGYETELLLPILHSGKHFVLANDSPSGDRSVREIIKGNEGFQNWTVIHPKKDQSTPWGGAFHPKLWLIKFSKFLRVVIGSGNLHVSDWQVWSNCLWYQDFPIIDKSQKEKRVQKNEKQGSQQDNNALWDFEGDFKSTLTEAVQAMMPQRMSYKELLRVDLEEYNFKDVKIILVSNLVGRTPDVSKYGKGKLLRIAQAFKGKFELPEGTNPNEKKMSRIDSVVEKKNEKIVNNSIQNDFKIVTYECSSVGNIDSSFLEEFYGCVTGVKDYSDLKTPVVKGKKKDPKNADDDTPNKVVDRFRLIFPTQSYIENEAVFGPESAGPVILNQKYYERPSFPKSIFHQFCAPEHYYYHHGLIPHLKIMAVTNRDLIPTDDSLIYIGSHNFTAAAWGRFEKNFTQIYSSNTELGIVYPPCEGSAEIKQEILNTLSFDFKAPRYSQDMVPFLRSFE